MALLLQNEDGTYATKCPLCDLPLAKPFFATSHFIADESDKLFRYSDAAMHWDCYANWEYQQRFAAQYFEAVANSEYKNPYWPTVLATPNVNVRANCGLNPPMVDIQIRMIGPGPRVNLEEWDKWIGGGYRETCSHALESTAIESIVSDLQASLPTLESVRLAAQKEKDTT